MTSVRQRVLRGLGATAFGQAVHLGYQLASVPLFLALWGTQLYGEWLILSAIPAYLALSDLGFGRITGNEMSIRAAAGDRDGALAALHSGWTFVSMVTLLAALLLLAVVWVLPVERWLGVTVLRPSQVGALLSALTLLVLVGVQGEFISAGYRSIGEFPRVTLLSNVSRLAEICFAFAAAALRGGPVSVALAMVIMRTLGMCLLAADLRRRASWIRFGWARATRSTVRRLANPSIAYLGFPLGNALATQGMLMVVAAATSTTGVVVFATTRTMVNSARQFADMINLSVWPEVSLAYGAGNVSLLRAMHRYATQASLLSAIAFVTTFWVLGEWIIRLWTAGAVSADVVFLRLLLLGLAFGVLWTSSSVVATGSNRHQKIAGAYVVVTGLALLLASFLTPRWGLPGAGLALAMTDLLMVAYVLPRSLVLVEDRGRPYLRAFLAPHRMLALALRKRPRSGEEAAVAPYVSRTDGR